MEGVDFAIRAGAGALYYAQEARYNRLSDILQHGLREGSTPGFLKDLSVVMDGPVVKVDLTEWPPYVEDPHPDSDEAVDSTRTKVIAHWGDDGICRLYVVANQKRTIDGRITTYDYESGRSFLDNSLHLGGLLRVAKTAQRMQRAEARAETRTWRKYNALLYRMFDE